MIDLRAASILVSLTLGCHGGSEVVSARPTSTEDPPPAPTKVDASDLPRGFDTLSLSRRGTGEGCWIRDDGRIVCWGNDEDGDLGGAIPQVPFGAARVVPGIRDVVQIDGDNRRCAVTKAGEVYCFGPLNGYQFEARRVWGVSPPMRGRAMWSDRACQAGFNYLDWREPKCDDTSYFVDSEGRLAWYADERVGGFQRHKWELVDGIEDVVELSVASYQACVRSEGGSIHCLDDGSPPGHVARIEGIESPLQLSANYEFTLVLDGSGVVHRVRLHDGAWHVEATGFDDVVELVESCGLRAGGTVTCDLAGEHWDLAAPPARTVVHPHIHGFACIIAESDATVHCTRRRGARLRRIESLSPARAIVSWKGRPCALHESGEVRCTNERFKNPELSGVRAEAIASNENTLCVLSDGRVICWADDWDSELNRLPVDDAVGFERFADHMCVRRADASLICMDHSGDEYAELRWDPIQGLGTVVEVAVSGAFACAREHDGSVRCWGDGEAGRRGNPQAGATLSPAKVQGIDDAVDIDAVQDSVCAVRSTGQVMCWEFQRDMVPEVMAGFADVAQISLQPNYGYGGGLCARHQDGTVSCAWALAKGEPQLAEPTRIVGVESAVHIQAAPSGGCALTGADPYEVVCWGSRFESFGLRELGDSTGSLSLPGVRGLDFGSLHEGCFDVPGEQGPLCWGIDHGRKIPDSSFTVPFEDPWEDRSVDASMRLPHEGGA